MRSRAFIQDRWHDVVWRTYVLPSVIVTVVGPTAWRLMTDWAWGWSEHINVVEFKPLFSLLAAMRRICRDPFERHGVNKKTLKKLQRFWLMWCKISAFRKVYFSVVPVELTRHWLGGRPLSNILNSSKRQRNNAVLAYFLGNQLGNLKKKLKAIDQIF